MFIAKSLTDPLHVEPLCSVTILSASSVLTLVHCVADLLTSSHPKMSASHSLYYRACNRSQKPLIARLGIYIGICPLYFMVHLEQVVRLPQ